MRKLSLWAYHHKWTTRLLFVFIYSLLNVVCLFFSEALYAEGIVIPAYFSYLLCFPFLIALVLYPSRKNKNRYANFYLFQKSMDGILFTVSFLLVICSMNRFVQNNASFITTVVSAAEPTVKPIKPANKLKVQIAQATFVAKHWKELKQNYRLLRKGYRNAAKGEKGALITLATIVALALFMLVLGLSCNIACSGAEGAALTVLLLGTGLIVFLLVKVIQAIKRDPKKKEPVEEKPVDS